MTAIISSVSGFLLGRGNRKLGSRIFTFSIPAVSTCPGKSELCKSACYATKGQMGMKTQPFSKRLKASRRAGFARRVVEEIRCRYVKTVRIHVAGDFYSAKYVRKWIRIAESCPEVRFFAYTRSWRVPAIRADLEEFSRLKNVRLWYSCDAETGMPRKVPKRIRIAYMAMDDLDEPGRAAHLVFRVKRDTVLKHQAGILVCPVENGVTHSTCEKCRLCSAPDEKDPRRYALPVLA